MIRLTAEPRTPGPGCYMQRGNRLEWWSATGRVYEAGGRRYQVYQRGTEKCPVELCPAAAETLADNARRAAKALEEASDPPRAVAAQLRLF